MPFRGEPLSAIAGYWPPVLRVTAVVVLLSAGLPSAANAQATSATEYLAKLCPTHSSEPACQPGVVVSEEEAWVLVRAACRTDRSDTCREFLARLGPVLTFDAKRKSWSAEWERGPLPLKFDVAGTPTLRLRPGAARPLKIVVTDISPLTYSAQPGTPKEEDLAVVANLKTFLALAGTGVQGLLQTLAAVPALGPAPSPNGAPQPPPPQFSPKIAPPAPTGPPCKPPDVAPVAAIVRDRNLQLVDLARAMRQLETELDAVERARVAFVRQVQVAEDGTLVLLAALPRPSSQGLEKAFSAFEVAVAALRGHTDQLASCQPALSAFSALLAGPADRTVLGTLGKEVAATSGSCTIAGSAAQRSLGFSLAEQAEELVACSTKLPETTKLYAAALKGFTDRLIDPVQAEAKVWAAVDKAAASKARALAGLETLTREVQNARQRTWGGVLIREIAVSRQNPQLPWNKAQSHSIVVKADSPYVKELTLSREPSLEHPFRLESATGQVLGYGIGIIYTPLYEHGWTAVAPPGSTTKVITETKRETRAGDLAAFLSYRFTQHWPHTAFIEPIVDLGVGVTSDRPAFFLGGALQIGRVARLGYGWSPQRITRLAPGQEVGVTEVASNDDIRTRKAFELKNSYVSLVFALDSLSLFNRP